MIDSRTPQRTAIFIFIPALAALLTASCGSETPSGGSNVPSTTLASAPTPTPTPTPVPQVGTSCGLGFVQPVEADCRRENPTFLDQVEGAIDKLAAEKPEIFDKSDIRGGGGFRILSLGQFYVGVIENLEDAGLCAVFDGEEVAVKNSNEFNDQYDIELASGHVRRGPDTYRSTCYPAVFPVELGPPPATAGCTLAPSRDVACGREVPHHLAQVEAAIDTVVREKPELFDLNDTAPGTNFVKVVNVDGYVQSVILELGEMGFCAIWDGEEVQVKNSNDFSDHIDILLASDHIRKGEGAYRSSCYPAAF